VSWLIEKKNEIREMEGVKRVEARREKKTGVREREERSGSFLTFKKHYLKLLIEATYCLMC